jgi:hypothetical protein
MTTYWIDMFIPKTWQEFLNAGGTYQVLAHIVVRCSWVYHVETDVLPTYASIWIP